MYTAYFRFSGRPFQLSPDHRFFFGSRPHRKAVAYLEYGLAQEEGFIVITGDVGTGKTTLVDYLFSKIDRGKFQVAKVGTTQLDADDMLRVIARSFGISHQGSDKATLLQRLEDFLIRAHGAGRRSLLVIDEVQNVPRCSLEELRMLSNYQFNGQGLLQIYLVGQPQFRATLADLEQLHQRVNATYHLEPMESEETRGYIRHRLQRVGWRDDPSISEPAFEAIHAETGGVPRRINLLCDRLLLYGYLEEVHQIDTYVVDEVARDLSLERSPPPSMPGRPTDQDGAAERTREKLRLLALQRRHRTMLTRLNRIVGKVARRFEQQLAGDGEGFDMGGGESPVQVVEMLTRVAAKLIPLERQAFDLDDNSKRADDDAAEVQQPPVPTGGKGRGAASNVGGLERPARQPSPATTKIAGE